MELVPDCREKGKMKKIGASLLGMAGLIFLLGYGAAPVRAYAPPLAASASFDSSSVTVSVWDPMRQVGRVEPNDYGAPVVMALQQHNGLMAWVFQSGLTYHVTWCTYDPPQGKFVYGSNGPFSSVSQLQVKDGVIAWVADQLSPHVYVVTYDPEVPLLHPASSPWQTHNYPSSDIVSMKTADGVVAWTTTKYLASFRVYHPGLKVWRGEDAVAIVIDPFYIYNATVIVGTDHYGYDGYDWVQNHYTDLLAYFVAQPTSGKAPLWVWFTDLSVGPTSTTVWNWVFGDGANTMYLYRHSSYHTYQKGRGYTARLNIYNGQPLPHATITVYPINLPSLPLLLLN